MKVNHNVIWKAGIFSLCLIMALRLVVVAERGHTEVIRTGLMVSAEGGNIESVIGPDWRVLCSHSDLILRVRHEGGNIISNIPDIPAFPRVDGKVLCRIGVDFRGRAESRTLSGRGYSSPEIERLVEVSLEKLSGADVEWMEDHFPDF